MVDYLIDNTLKTSPRCNVSMEFKYYNYEVIIGCDLDNFITGTLAA